MIDPKKIQKNFTMGMSQWWYVMALLVFGTRHTVNSASVTLFNSTVETNAIRRHLSLNERDEPATLYLLLAITMTTMIVLIRIIRAKAGQKSSIY